MEIDAAVGDLVYDNERNGYFKANADPTLLGTILQVTGPNVINPDNYDAVDQDCEDVLLRD